MDEHELAALQDPTAWNEQTAEVSSAADDSRVVVPIRFTPDEFARVARFARATGLPLPQCIHQAMLERIEKAETTPGHRASA